MMSTTDPNSIPDAVADAASEAWSDNDWYELAMLPSYETIRQAYKVVAAAVLDELGFASGLKPGTEYEVRINGGKATTLRTMDADAS